MNCTLVKSNQLITKTWSGGTTKELFIFPSTASYQLKNFQFRLSTATVETETSEFTLLPGVSRKIMILSGSITIQHENHYTKQLNKFDTDSFEGDWKTSSIGKCTDFNLMTTGNTSGDICALQTILEKPIHYTIKKNCHWLFVYLYTGETIISYMNEKLNLAEGDLLIIEQPTLQSIEIKSIKNSELIITEIAGE